VLKMIIELTYGITQQYCSLIKNTFTEETKK